MAKKLNEKQLAAVQYLSLPKLGGMTYEQIAKEVGVDRATIFRWKNDDTFNEEVKKQIMRNTIERLPEVLASIPDHIINDGNAAMLRTLLQAHGMLTDKVEVENKNAGASDVDAMKAEIERMRKSRESHE